MSKLLVDMDGGERWDINRGCSDEGLGNPGNGELNNGGIPPPDGGDTGASGARLLPEAGEGLDWIDNVSVDVLSGDGERERL